MVPASSSARLDIRIRTLHTRMDTPRMHYVEVFAGHRWVTIADGCPLPAYSTLERWARRVKRRELRAQAKWRAKRRTARRYWQRKRRHEGYRLEGGE